MTLSATGARSLMYSTRLLRDLDPILKLIEAHIMAAERLHGDDTTVPVLAKGKTDIGRCRTYVRDDKPFGRPSPCGDLLLFA
jgi:hypothetical protein